MVRVHKRLKGDDLIRLEANKFAQLHVIEFHGKGKVDRVESNAFVNEAKRL